ncbi:PREDICTED: uncharacterized protein LOC104763359 [Camelina sativa]|uniref:Uncharacterized protein LOC104763359 n=1 Tax=Camelina sativa TaxID=90675 RepID=A0ABM0XF54_CAMSA|nr:PREDICTED: uncharacterized protein LOC104763359 [Camelina sativa]
MGPPTLASHLMTVADLFQPDSGTWNKPLIQELLPEYESDILKLKPSKLRARDRWAWLPTRDGVYSTKSGYFEAQAPIRTLPDSTIQPPGNQASQFNWKSHIWAVKTSPKTKLLLWKLAQQALPVGENLSHRKITELVHCPHCKAPETELHLFFHCPFAAKTWSKAPFKETFDPSRVSSPQLGLRMVNELTCLPPTGLGEGPLFPWIMWIIWTSRNNLIFSKIQIPVEEALLLAILRAKEWQQAQIRKAPPSPLTNPPPRLPTESQLPGTITCCTDASWISDSKAGLGWTFQNHRHHIIGQGSDLALNV